MPLISPRHAARLSAGIQSSPAPGRSLFPQALGGEPAEVTVHGHVRECCH